MESGTGLLSLGSHESLKPPSDGRPPWRNPPVQGEFNARPSEIFPANNFSVLEEKESPCGLKEHDYIGLAENSAFEQPPPVELEKDSELSLGGEDLRLELGLGLGTTSTRKNDHEKYKDFLLKQKDAVKSQKGGNSKAPAETSRHGFPGVAATLQKPWQNGMPGTADCLTSSNRTIRDYQIPNKIPTFAHDHDEGPSRASLSPFYGPNVKNGMKRGYTEAMHDVSRYDIASAVPVVGKVAEGEPKALPTKHQQNGYMSSFLPPKPPKVSTHRVVGSEKSATHAFVPRNEKMTRENAILPFNPPENCKEPATNDPPPPKGQVVGWPPIRSYRKQNLAKPTEMFVKVNMDGMTVGRKVDLNAHSSYEALYIALEDMFQASNNGGQGTFQSVQARESFVDDAKQIRLLDGSEYVLTYEDQDGDWMMVGDVPWGMFVNMVRRLRITRQSEATGLAPTRRPEINK